MSPMRLCNSLRTSVNQMYAGVIPHDTAVRTRNASVTSNVTLCEDAEAHRHFGAHLRSHETRNRNGQESGHLRSGLLCYNSVLLAGQEARDPEALALPDTNPRKVCWASRHTLRQGRESQIALEVGISVSWI